jgi:ATP synthase protein I
VTPQKPDSTKQEQGPIDGQDPLRALDRDIEAFEARRRKSPSSLGSGAAAGEGYSVLGQMLGGVLGGVGLGWLADRLLHTSPWGLVGGLVIGSGLSIFSTVQTASRMGANTKTRPPAATPPADEHDDEA